MSTNPIPEPPHCARCGEKIRTSWIKDMCRKEGRNLCGLCWDDEMQQDTRTVMNELADKLMKGWGGR